eukprot:CAMPEP_0205821002 /NCGR_PEP_ID=MMETSP0206-20130828/4378_1 /ASSEMBLY_ACC=CAM_ASM_000279 /TAXON_ID=36767 /ORGANISM="Euplotes focardii, Strain TN1" /LENGTH=140 /DNA_ID=CAMNT_0053116167 /DNA_START=36 /DNA_END=458 /DNA_ORIENTATION=+
MSIELETKRSSEEDAYAADAEHAAEEVVGWGPKCARCVKNFNHLMYHKEDNKPSGRSLYCGNTGKNWGKICAAFAVLWVGVGIFFFAMLALVVEFGTTTYWVYLAIFGVVVLAIVGAVIVGTVENTKENGELFEVDEGEG